MCSILYSSKCLAACCRFLAMQQNCQLALFVQIKEEKNVYSVLSCCMSLSYAGCRRKRERKQYMIVTMYDYVWFYLLFYFSGMYWRINVFIIYSVNMSIVYFYSKFEWKLWTRMPMASDKIRTKYIRVKRSVIAGLSLHGVHACPWNKVAVGHRYIFNKIPYNQNSRFATELAFPALSIAWDVESRRKTPKWRAKERRFSSVFWVTVIRCRRNANR